MKKKRCKQLLIMTPIAELNDTNTSIMSEYQSRASLGLKSLNESALLRSMQTPPPSRRLNGSQSSQHETEYYQFPPAEKITQKVRPPIAPKPIFTQREMGLEPVSEANREEELRGSSQPAPRLQQSPQFAPRLQQPSQSAPRLQQSPQPAPRSLSPPVPPRISFNNDIYTLPDKGQFSRSPPRPPPPRPTQGEVTYDSPWSHEQINAQQLGRSPQRMPPPPPPKSPQMLRESLQSEQILKPKKIPAPPPPNIGRVSQEQQQLEADDEAATIIEHDRFMNSKYVIGLNAKNFAGFLKCKDTALVMFYKPCVPLCKWSRKHFVKAAGNTKRDNHVYAAVNCSTERQLCEQEQADPVPFFRLYSRGNTVGSIREPKTFKHETMTQFVENAPVLNVPMSEACKRYQPPVHDY